jgi:FtsP/CotA-like multicopper oxidase with cupredoxin domain
MFLVVLCLTLGYSSVHAQSLQSPDWDASLRLPEAPDLNPDPRIVEIDLEAKLADVEIEPGRTVRAWTYNGGLPGPLIRVRVGDRLIVHFTNNLEQPTTVHWHGLQVPIQMDGVPGSSQPNVPPRGGTFTYDFTVPDAGLYWYHPHVMSAAQVGFGLYGPLIVDDPTENVGTTDELIIVLSDIALAADGTFEDPNSGGSSGMAFGREGTDVLINGRKTPRIPIRSGAPQRWRIVNAAKSRYFLLDLDGLNFRQIGADGGLMERPIDSRNVLLATGERVDLIVTPTLKPGETLDLVSLLHNRGYGSVEFRSIETLLTMVGSDLPAYSAPPLPEVRRDIRPLELAGATRLNIDLTIAQLPNGMFQYGINGVPFATMRPLLAKLGETQIWTIRNTTKWSHPFHLHGFFFQVLGADGQPVRPLAWKDTVDVPFDQTASFVVRFDDDRPGTWMYHCHILDHADGGLMGTVIVGEPSGEPHDHNSQSPATR